MGDRRQEKPEGLAAFFSNLLEGGKVQQAHGEETEDVGEGDDARWAHSQGQTRSRRSQVCLRLRGW